MSWVTDIVNSWHNCRTAGHHAIKRKSFTISSVFLKAETLLMEEAEFIRKLQAGDTAAYRELVLLHGKRVINACYRLILDRQDAEDLSQEVFIEVFQSIGSFRGSAKLSTWIYRIAVTKSLDEIKKRKRKKRVTTLGRLLHLDDVAHLLGGGAMPDAPLHEEESVREIARAMDALPDNQRIAFSLGKLEGFSNGEIAEIMRTTTVAVESLIHRAKKRLTAALEKNFGKQK
jgi:RNA polymerase sigma-70 factor, ECF subfamily